MNKREATIIGVNKLAASIVKNGWTRNKEAAIFRATSNYNNNNEDEIFVAEADDGICIEDEYYRFERF